MWLVDLDVVADGSVLEQLRARQRREGTSLGRLASELLAKALADTEDDAVPAPLAWVAQPMAPRVALEDRGVRWHFPDGQTLVTGLHAILWDVTDRGRLRQLGPPLTERYDRVESVTFSSDGHTLTTVSDSFVTLWDMRPLEELRRDAVWEACIRAGGPLDEATWGFYAPGISYQDTCAGR